MHKNTNPAQIFMQRASGEAHDIDAYIEAVEKIVKGVE